MRSTRPEDQRALEVVVAAAWNGRRLEGVDQRVLRNALRLARSHQVEEPVTRLYADSVPDHALRRLDLQAQLFAANLLDATSKLAKAGVRPLLIKADPRRVYEYDNFDLVVGADGWDCAVRTLAEWSTRRAVHPLEPGKMLLYPACGPAAHLHREVSWFGIPAFSTERLRAGAVDSAGLPYLLPAPADSLRLWVGHAVFQNLAFLLSELLSLRELLTPSLVAEASRGAAQDGWQDAFSCAVDLAEAAVVDLDRGVLPRLPVTIPPGEGLLMGWRHSVHLLRVGRPVKALRELLLRPVLVIAKVRRVRMM